MFNQQLIPLLFIYIYIYILSLCLQQIGLLIASFLNALLSAACCTGLLMAISVTVAHSGQGLMQGCNDTEVPINARSPVSAQCPFDTTRIYVSVDVSSCISLSLKCSSSLSFGPLPSVFTVQATTFEALNHKNASEKCASLLSSIMSYPFSFPRLSVS